MTQTKLSGSRKPHGAQVKRTIENFYRKKKGYSPEHAAKIAGAVAEEEHEKKHGKTVVKV